MLDKRRGEMVITGGDEAAMLLSAACLVHCLALPLVWLTLPTLGVALSQTPLLHQVLGLLAVALSCGVLLAGYAQHHRRSVLIWGLAGAVGLLVSSWGADACCSIILAWLGGSMRSCDIPLAAWSWLLVSPLACLCLLAAHHMNRRGCKGTCKLHRSPGSGV